jgi:5'-nucleotidase
MSIVRFARRAQYAVLAGAAAALLVAAPASAASTSFNVTNTVTAVNPGTCPANFLASFTVGATSSGTSTLDITGNTATQTLSNGLVLTGPVTGNSVTVSVERPVTASGQTFTERRESTFAINGTSATGTSKLTATFPNGGTCNADFALTGTLGAALIPGQATTTTAATTTVPATTAPPATTAAPATTAPATSAPTTTAATLPATGLDSSVIVLVGALVAAIGGAVVLVGRRRAQTA